MTVERKPHLLIGGPADSTIVVMSDYWRVAEYSGSSVLIESFDISQFVGYRAQVWVAGKNAYRLAVPDSVSGLPEQLTVAITLLALEPEDLAKVRFTDS